MRGRGGSKAVWNFSENSSILEGEGVPNSDSNLIIFVIYLGVGWGGIRKAHVHLADRKWLLVLTLITPPRLSGAPPTRWVLDGGPHGLNHCQSQTHTSRHRTLAGGV